MDNMKEKYNTISPEPVSLKQTEKIISFFSNSHKNNSKSTKIFLELYEIKFYAIFNINEQNNNSSIFKVIFK